MRRGRSTLRPRHLIPVAVMLVVLLVAGLTSVLFVWPATSRPEKVGAIFVLGGNGPRLGEGLTLAADGYAPELVLSVSVSLDSRAARCGTRYRGVAVVCFSPRPSSTQGEARFIGTYARAHHLGRIIVVSGRAQTTRARIRVQRCYHGQVLMVPAGAPAPLGAAAGDVVYEWGALLKAEVWQRSC